MTTDQKDGVYEVEKRLSVSSSLSRQRTKALVDEIPDPDPGATPEERAALVRTHIATARRRAAC